MFIVVFSKEVFSFNSGSTSPAAKYGNYGCLASVKISGQNMDSLLDKINPNFQNLSNDSRNGFSYKWTNSNNGILVMQENSISNNFL